MMKKIGVLALIAALMTSSFNVLVSAQTEQIQGHFEWSKGDIVPTAGKVTYEISFIPDDIHNYDIATTSIELDIAKAVPKSESDETWNKDNVTAIAFAKKGNLIKDVEISDYNIYDVDNNILPGTWEWINGDEIINVSGEYDVLFIPDDVNYEKLQTKVYINILKNSSSSVQYNAVTYDVGEFGNIVDGYNKTEKVKRGETVKNIPQVIAIDGYKHIGWELNGEMIDISSFAVKEKSVLKAVYIPVNKIKYLKGYDGYIYPDNPITRAEAATLFARVLGFDENKKIVTSENFSDINNSEWYADTIMFAAEKGIVSGYEDGTFRPDENITRAELAVMVYRYLEFNSTAKSHFEDVTAHWAERYIATLENLHIINGYEDGTFRPDNYITRAETVKCVNKMLGIDSSIYETGNIDFADIDGSHWAFEDISIVVY